MYSDDDLASAVKAGVMTEDTAAAFRSHVEALRRVPAVDEEYVRLVAGFNDIFVVIACSLLLLAVRSIAGLWIPWLGAAALAGTAWALAEFFVRKRKMALPAILLLVAFVGGVFSSGREAFDNALVGAALAAVASWLHWRRFKVPITVAAGSAAVVAGIALTLLGTPEGRAWLTPLVLLAGVAVFVVAMRWDASDVQRQTRRSDVAFWLHLLAAPLLVHPVVATLGLLDATPRVSHAYLVIALYAAITYVSLAIDRRALMVSALAYVLYVFTKLLQQHGVVNLNFASVALVLGSALLLLSAFWHRARAYALRFCPQALRRFLPPHARASTT